MEFDSKIFVAGHNGMVGSALVRKLKSKGFNNLILRSKSELDLTNQSLTEKFFTEEKPEYVFLSAAKVGGIIYNDTFPADFIYENLQIQNNVINSSYNNNVKKLMFLGSVCIYPKIVPQPIKEEYLMTGPLEPTNEGYALAKISGLKMCQMYRKQYGFNAISVMPANLYGINDNFNLDQCHVIPAMINKFVHAKDNNMSSVTLYGDGTPTREFLHVDDLADACLFLMNNYESDEHVNIGSSEEISIKELAEIISDEVGFKGEILWDTSKPNGTPKRKLDNSKLNLLGWYSSISLKNGIYDTVKYFIETGGKKIV
jgi:GDP-L-fucose synthase